MKSKHIRIIISIFIGTILVLSFVPRFYDISKFLPDYNIDENEIVEFAVGFLGGDLDQRFYSYGPLLAYVLTLVYMVMSWFSEGDINEFAQKVFFDNTQFYYAARFINAIISLVTGFVVFKIIKQIWNNKIALFSLPLLVFPFSEYLINFSVRVDTLLGLFYALSLYFMMRNFHKKSIKNYIFGAISLGMAFACKPLPSILIIPSILLCFYVLSYFNDAPSLASRNKKKAKSIQSKNKTIFQRSLDAITGVLKDYKFYLFFGFTLLSSRIFFPHAFTNWGAKGGFKEQQLGRISFEGGKDGFSGWRLDHYLDKLGLIFIILSVIGLLYGVYLGFKKKNYPLLLTLSFPIIYILAFAQGSARTYWYIPVIPFLIVGIMALFTYIFNYVKSENKQLIVGLIFIGLLIIQPTIDIVNRTLEYNAKENYQDLHTSLSSKKWIEENIPAKSNIALYGFYTNLPRLVDFNVNTQAQIGDYFMYYKMGNKYYSNLFVAAHQKYVKNPEHKVYNLITNLGYRDQHQKDQNVHLRYKNEQIEPYLEQLLVANKVDYLVTNHHQKNQLDKKIIKSFMTKEYPFGQEVHIYKITN